VDNYRKIIIDSLFPWFERDERYYLLAGDMGFGAIDRLREAYPERVINCGVMEPGTVGFAAGMSMSGLIPIFYTMVNFLAFRSLEQVRNDIVLQKLNVKLLGTGANNYFSMLGPSHCCGEDDVKVMELIGMKVYDPYRGDVPFERLVGEWLDDSQAGYLRV